MTLSRRVDGWKNRDKLGWSDSEQEGEDGGKDEELCKRTYRQRLEPSLTGKFSVVWLCRTFKVYPREMRQKKNLKIQVWMVSILIHYGNGCRDNEQVEEDDEWGRSGRNGWIEGLYLIEKEEQMAGQWAG